MSYEELKAKLEPYGQDHVLKYWSELNNDQQAALAKTIQALDLDRVKSQFEIIMKDKDGENVDKLMQPPPSDMIGNARAFPYSDDMLKWNATGLKLISQNKVAALLLAGGQGTRLGSPDPKGMFNFGMRSGRTLFQIQAERIQRLQNMAKDEHGNDCVIPWYIMTSGPTRKKTQEFLEKNNYFGLDSSNVFIFEQNVIPSLTLEGKLILKTKHEIAMNPDGNGGIYEALETGGALEDMKKRGIEHVHAYCVDNILVKVADPVFIGFCSSKGVPAGALVVNKSAWNEKVGVVCRVGDQYRVVEYSEIKEETAKATDSDGQLKFKAGNIANHYFTVDFLAEAAKRNDEMTLHRADKAIPVVNDAGETIKPDKPNGVKIEKFIFDVFAFTNQLGVLEVERSHSFSPLKNKSAPGASGTKETSRKAYFALNLLYLNNAGVTVKRYDGTVLTQENITHEDEIDISPLVSYAGEGLKENPKVLKEMTTGPVLLE